MTSDTTWECRKPAKACIDPNLTKYRVQLAIPSVIPLTLAAVKTTTFLANAIPSNAAHTGIGMLNGGHVRYADCHYTISVLTGMFRKPPSMTKALSEHVCLLHTCSFWPFHQICSAMNNLKHRHICHNTTHALNTVNQHTYCCPHDCWNCNTSYHTSYIRPAPRCCVPHNAFGFKEICLS